MRHFATHFKTTPTSKVLPISFFTIYSKGYYLYIWLSYYMRYRLPKTYKSKIYILLFMRISIPLKNVNFISMLMRIHAETVKCHPLCNGERLHVFAEFIIVEEKKRKCFLEMLVVYCQCCWSESFHFHSAHWIHQRN